MIVLEKKKIAYNFIYNTAYQILTILIPLVTTPYLSRVLQAEGIGKYSYAYSVANYFVLFSMMGVNNYGNRSVAKVRDDKTIMSHTFWSIYILQLFTSIVFSVIYMIYAVLFSNSKMAVIMILFVISAGFDINWLFWGLEEFKITVTRNVIVKLGTTVCLFLFVKNSSDVYLYGVIMVMGILMSQAVLWPFVTKRIDAQEIHNICIADIMRHIMPNLKLFISIIAVSIYKIMDKIMLGNMVGEIEVGYYESADKVITIPICIVTSLGTVMLPRMANLMAKGDDNEGLNNIILKSILFATFLTAPISIGIMSIAKEFVPLFYGKEFEPCVRLFYILLPSCIFVAIANVIRTQYLIPGGFDKIYILSCIAGAVINLAINSLLIPRFASAGAAFGTLTAELCVLLYQLACTRKQIKYTKIAWQISGILFGACLMGIVVYSIPLIKNNIICTIIVKIIVGAIIYGVFVALIYFITNRKAK